MDEKITIFDETRKVIIDVGEELSVEYFSLDHLNKALALAPGKMYYFGRLLKDLTKISSVLSLNVKTVRARIYQEAKISASSNHLKLTEDATKAIIQRNIFVQEAEINLIEAEANQANFKNLIDSFKKRQESLIEISRNLRGEANLRAITTS